MVYLSQTYCVNCTLAVKVEGAIARAKEHVSSMELAGDYSSSLERQVHFDKLSTIHGYIEKAEVAQVKARVNRGGMAYVYYELAMSLATVALHIGRNGV